MKIIEIRIFDHNDDGLLYQAARQMSYNEYKEILILYKDNILEKIINELELEINNVKNGNKEN